tara:strand:+ start:204 stop:662 length:459 start_codon:yes stop_codon:yes gene_type:complete
VKSMDEDNQSVDALVTLQERMVNLIKQLQMPLIETSMVIGNHIKQLMKSLNEYSSETGTIFPIKVTSPWELNVDNDSNSQITMELDKILSIVDNDRMDILATLIRVTLIETELDISEALLALRMWEHLARSQLAAATSPGQLFSPLVMPEEW